MVEPLHGWRQVSISDRRTKQEWAHALRAVVDHHDPDAERSVLVRDTRTTHGIGSLSATFPAEEVRRLRRKVERHSTPMHGRWLTLAEIEVRVPQSPALGPTPPRPGGPRHGGRAGDA